MLTAVFLWLLAGDLTLRLWNGAGRSGGSNLDYSGRSVSPA